MLLYIVHVELLERSLIFANFLTDLIKNEFVHRSLMKITLSIDLLILLSAFYTIWTIVIHLSRN